MKLLPIYSDAVLQALGWTLVHFLWQGTLIAASLAIVLALLHRRSAQLRYGVCCVALVVMVIAPVLTMKQLSYSGALPKRVAAQTARSRLVLLATPVWDVKDTLLKSSLTKVDGAMPLLVVLWMAGVSVLLVRLGMGLLVTCRMKRIGVLPVPAELEQRIQVSVQRLSIARPVRLLYSNLVQVPTVVGWLRPVILVPITFLTGLSAVQVEAVLIHELAHIRRHDYLVNLLQAFTEVILFYHPAVWWVSKRIRSEREHCCDDLAVATVGSALLYARALSTLEEQRSKTPQQIALAADGGMLTMRIQRILGLDRSPVLSQPATILLVGALVVGTCFTAIGHAQTRCFSEIRLAVPGLPEADRLHILEALQADTSCSAKGLAETALWLVHDLGYFKAALAPEIQSKSTSVPAIVITPGFQYHFRGFSIHGNHTLTAEQLQAAYALHPGDLFRYSLIGKTLENLQKQYAQAGLKNEVTNPTPSVDEKTHSVTMDLQVDEGT